MAELEEFFIVNALYLWGALAALVLILGLWILAIQLRVSQVVASHNRLIGNVDRGNLEDALGRQISYILETKGKVESLQRDLIRIDGTLQLAVQRVGLVRFNPFEDTGGDQSFSIALLDARGDGIVLSSLFARRETRVFAKPIQAGKSSHVLTDEEKKAIEIANAAPVPMPSPTGGAATAESGEATQDDAS